MSDDPVERAARAHYHRRWTVSHPSWAQLSKPTRATLIGDMRAAIASLREPSEAMKKAWADYFNATYQLQLPDKHITGAVEAVCANWERGIDAALSCAAGESED